ncbi:SRPBCC family protein [Peribacillus simplex]|uniref:SRPBCC family protein n=2 Tax=Peribacillus TaxID=2675229 RepID=A0AA90T219_9BACI|nr:MULTISPECIES: SRPBCC family protein [Peribacillus]MDP1420922.1 SRPBCC family protein [Peribacillus simplex]MDP1452864.1 SRPBCC family protein [Peribacillus frigoritolerans]
MVNVLTDIKIKCTRNRVAEYAANPDNAPEWYVNIDSAEWQTQKPLSIGSRIAFKAQFLGRQLAYIYEIVEFIPEQKLVMRTANGPFPMETTYTWETIDNNLTRMTLQNKGIPSGFSKLLTPLMSLLMKRANKKDLKKIKDILEKRSLSPRSIT